MFLHAGDTINGAEGKATAIIEGQVHDLFFVKAAEATLEKTKAEIKVLGKRSVQHKTAGWSGTGSLNMYYMTSLFRNMALKYAKTGKDIYFTLTIVNEDPGTTIGKQTIVLYNCNFDSIVLAKLDAEVESLDESLDFTFEDFDILDSFGNPVTV